MTSHLFFSAGDFSGDQHAAGVIAELKKRHTQYTISAIGGPAMATAGADLIADTLDRATVGFVEVVRNLGYFYQLEKMVRRHIFRTRPAAVILVDNPGFNLRQARFCYEIGVPVYYFIPPQLWAWHESRLAIIKKCVARVFCIFPFEEKYYRDRGVAADYVGNPVAVKIDAFLKKHSPASDHRDGAWPCQVCVLPGSRVSEWNHHMPVLLEVMKRKPGTRFVIALADSLRAHPVVTRDRERIESLANAAIAAEPVYETIAGSRLVLCASGTASLETALLGKPGLCFYRMGAINHFLARRFARVPYISLANLLVHFSGSRDLIYEELIQDNFTVEAILKKMDTVPDTTERFRRLRDLLGNQDASRTTAQCLHRCLDARPCRVEG